MVPQCPPHTSEHSDSRCRETRHPAEFSPQRAPTSPPVSLLPTLPPQPFLRVSRIPEVPHQSVSDIHAQPIVQLHIHFELKKKHLVSSLKSFNPYISSSQIPNFCSKNSTCPAFGCISQQRHVWREGRRPKGLRDLADHRGQPRVEVAGGAHPHGEGDRAGRHWRMQKSESKARALLSKPHSKVRQKFSKYQSMHFV